MSPKAVERDCKARNMENVADQDSFPVESEDGSAAA
jgi:hypothetical protein